MHTLHISRSTEIHLDCREHTIWPGGHVFDGNITRGYIITNNDRSEISMDLYPDVASATEAHEDMHHLGDPLHLRGTRYWPEEGTR